MLQDIKIIAIYCMVDDLLKSIDHKEPSNRKLFDSEIITTAIVSCLFFGGHLNHGRNFMKMHNMCPKMLDKTRFCRRLHSLQDVLVSIFFHLGQYLKNIEGASDYIVDSFPVAVCDNMRISRSRILKGEQWRGKHASMHRYFYGVKVHVLTTKDGIPIEFSFVPARENDVQGLKKLPLTVNAESCIYGDSGYTDYTIEDNAWEADQIKIMIQRKSNSKRPDPPYTAYLKQAMRKRIETSFSEIKAYFRKSIHAVTFPGFLIKIVLFIFAYSLNRITSNLG
jgi:hypothetical protein